MAQNCSNVYKTKGRLVPEHLIESSHLVSKGLHKAGGEHGLQVQADILQQLHHFVRTCPPDRSVSMAATLRHRHYQHISMWRHLIEERHQAYSKPLPLSTQPRSSVPPLV